MEIERKFLIDGFPALPEWKRAWVRQGYLSLSPEVRIRSQQEGTSESYRLCIKGEGALVREEIELELDQDRFERLAALLPKPMICKDYRVYRLENGLYLECSHVDPETETSFYYAEVEFPDQEQAQRFCPPAFLGREVTYDPQYRMKAYYQRRE